MCNEENEIKIFNTVELGIEVRIMKNEDGSISINVEDTAVGFGWTQGKLEKLDNGKNCRIEVASKIADALEVTIEELIEM